MAIYHLAVKHASRRQGRSALAHAHYIAREGPYAQGRFVEQFVEVEHRNMPAWAQDTPQAFWTAADTYERANGRLYTELEIALPRELARPEQAALARSFIDSQIGTAHPCSWALHVSRALDGEEQPHVHVMVSERRHDGIDRGPALFFKRANPDAPARGGAAKDPAWNHRDKVLELRVAWVETANRALERAGLEVRIDHRSLAAQGIDRTPEPKLGPEQTALLRQGIVTPQAAEVLELRQDRAALARVEQEVARLQARRRDRGGGERAYGRARPPLAMPSPYRTQGRCGLVQATSRRSQAFPGVCIPRESCHPLQGNACRTSRPSCMQCWGMLRPPCPRSHAPRS